MGFIGKAEQEQTQYKNTTYNTKNKEKQIVEKNKEDNYENAGCTISFGERKLHRAC